MDRKGLRWAAGGMALALFLLAAGARAGQVALISQMDPVPDSFGNSGFPVMSADGRYVLFQSEAPNLVPGQVDDNLSTDLFLRDRVTGATTLISHAAGKPTVAGHAAAPLGNGFQTLDADLSADGRYAVFLSAWTDLVAGVSGANGTPQAYLYDRVTGATTLISHAAGNPAAVASGPAATVRISADGNSVVFSSKAFNLVPGQTSPPITGSGPVFNVFLYDRPSGAITVISHRSGATTTGSGASLGPVISADGGYVAFSSEAADLLPGLTGSGLQAIFLYERASGAITLVSHAAGSPLALPNNRSFVNKISTDGRWIAFLSGASNLIAGQVPVPAGNVFLYDRISGSLRLVSHTTASSLTPGGGDVLAMSADGRYVTFSSQAPDLVPGQVNPTAGSTDLFVYDRVADAVSLVSHTADSPTTTTGGAYYETSLSADGRYIAFVSPAAGLVPNQTDAPDTPDVFVYDQTSRTTVLASHVQTSLTTSANGDSQSALISADGGVVAFASRATDLAEGWIDPNGFQDLYAFDRPSAEVTALVRRDPDVPLLSPAGPSSSAGLSADGRYAVFASAAAGLVPGQIDLSDSPDPFGFRSGTWDVFLRDLATGRTTLLSRSQAVPPTAASGFTPAISADGNFAAFPGPDPSNFAVLGRLWVYDRVADALTLANHPPGLPGQADGLPKYQPSLSADGRWIANTCSGCHDLVAGQQDGEPDNFEAFNVFLYDRLTGTNTLVSHASGSATKTGDLDSFYSRISADGRFVVFSSGASDLVAGQTGFSNNLFLYDRDTGAVSLVTHTAGSAVTGTGDSAYSVPVLSADGRWIVYESGATNLVPGQIDTNDDADVFLYDRVSDVTALVSHSALSAVTAGDSQGSIISGSEPVGISADGRWIVFCSEASDLVAGGGNPDQTSAVYLYDRTSGKVALVSSAAGSPNLARFAFQPVLSADGSRIAFLSPAADLVPAQSGGPALNLFVQERATGARTLVGPVSDSSFIGSNDANLSVVPRLSMDGGKIAFTSSFMQVDGDLNGDWDAYLYDAAAAPAGGPVTLPSCNLFSGALRSNVRKVLTVAGACGVPATAKQVVVKLAASRGTGKGNVQLYPGNVTSPSSGILRFNRGAARSAAGFTVSLGNGGIAVAFTSQIDLVAGDYNRQPDAYLFSLDGGSTGGGGPVTVPPCILLDTRRPTDGPALHSNVARVVKATGLCGVPATAQRVTVKVTAFQGTGKGNVRFYPGDLSQPSTGILRFSRGQTAAATFDLPLAPGAGTLTLLPFVAGNGTAGVSLEVDGYTP